MYGRPSKEKQKRVEKEMKKKLVHNQHHKDDKSKSKDNKNPNLLRKRTWRVKQKNDGKQQRNTTEKTG